MAGADRGDPGQRHRGRIPTHVEDQWWIINLLQLRRIGRIASGTSRVTPAATARQFFLAQLHGTARPQRLCRNCPECRLLPARLEMPENLLHAAKMLH
jgi:hypothetical protein